MSITGQTSRAMLDAAPEAFYVWCNGNLSYPKRLAASLGRSDLRILRIGEFNQRTLSGYRGIEVVVDHATKLLADQVEYLLWLREGKK